MNSGPGAVVIPFAKKPTPDEVLALLSKGKTQREAAERIGISTRTVKRIVASSRGQNLAGRVPFRGANKGDSEGTAKGTRGQGTRGQRGAKIKGTAPSFEVSA